MNKPEVPNFMDFGRMLEQLQVPGVDVKSLADAQRKNVEALTQANQQAFAGLQALAARQAELLQAAAAGMQNAMQQMQSGNPGEAAGTQLELARRTFEKALADMRELAEIVSKSQAEAYQTLSKRFQESLEELRGAMTPPKSGK